MPRDEAICRRALHHWGEAAQTTMVMEECGELIAAISQHMRGRVDERRLAEEIADVRICLRQLSIMVGDDLVDEQYEQMLTDLDYRLPAGGDADE